MNRVIERDPNRRERLFRKLFGYWPKSYVRARLRANDANMRRAEGAYND